LGLFGFAFAGENSAFFPQGFAGKALKAILMFVQIGFVLHEKGEK